jgi:hypothetical protein
MKQSVCKFVFLALKEELAEEGYDAHELEALVKNYSWFLAREVTAFPKFKKLAIQVISHGREISSIEDDCREGNGGSKPCP